MRKIGHYSLILLLGGLLSACGNDDNNSTASNATTALSVSIATATVVEGNAGTASLDFTVTLSAASTSAITVDYATSNGTATAGSDYTASTGTLTIAAGATSGTLSVLVNGDTAFETAETLTLTLSNPSIAVLGTSTAVGTISNDDTVPAISVGTVSMTEGDAGTANLNFPISLTAASAVDILVDYATSNGTATAGSDYTANTGTLTIPAGTAAITLSVAIAGDTVFEPDETLTLTLSNPAQATLGAAAAIGTILNNDAVPSISIAPVSITEGNDGFTPGAFSVLTFTANLSAASTAAITVDYATSDGTALQALDYSQRTGSLMFPAGTVVQTIDVAVFGDLFIEADETLTLTLSNPVNATLGTATAVGTILDDDIQPTVGATNVSMAVTGKSLDFSWTLGTQVDHYRLMVNADGVSGFSVVPSASNIANTTTAVSVEIPVHLTNWPTAIYMLEACDSADSACIVSPNQVLSLADSVAATVYAKADNTGAGDQFGYSTAISDDGLTLAIGAPREDAANDSATDAGAVYLLTRTAANPAWSQQAYLQASNLEADDKFGWAVTLSADGNTLAVGARLEGGDALSDGTVGGSNNNVFGAGAVYVFSRSGTAWSQSAYLKAASPQSGIQTPVSGEEFGRSLALSDDGLTLAVGAPGRDVIDPQGVLATVNNVGGVYVFTLANGQWTQQALLFVNLYSNLNAAINDGNLFGWSVALSADGNTLAVGAIQEHGVSLNINGDQTVADSVIVGAAYVYTRSNAAWSQQAYVKASISSKKFGTSVALSSDGNTLAVGAPQDNNGTAAIGVPGAGSVYMYSRSAATWSPQQSLQAFNPDINDDFGTAVALSNDGLTLAVGAGSQFLSSTNGEGSAATGIGGNQADNTALKSGAVYVYARSGAVWSDRSYVKAANTGANDLFGTSVGLSGDGQTLAVGASGEASNATGVDGSGAQTGQADDSLPSAGAVYVY